METDNLNTQKNHWTVTVKNVIDFLIVALILFVFYPYEFYSAILNTPTNLMSSLYVLFFVAIIGLTLLFTRKKRNIPPFFFVIVIVQCLGYVLCNVIKGSAFPTGPIMMSCLSVALVLFLSSTSGLNSFFKKYNVWILVMAILGVVAFALSWFGLLGAGIPFLDLSDDEIMSNYIITFCNNDGEDIFRYCGYFDEPGAMASWGMYALLFNKMFLKNGKLEKLLIILLLATFSLGYYIQLVAYLLFFHLIPNRNRRLGSFLLIIVLVLVYLGLKSFQGTKYQETYDITIGRIETVLDDSKKTGIAVDDREDFTIQAREEFKKYPIWGTPSGEREEFGNNIYEPLALYGIAGTLLIYFPFLCILIIAIKNRDRNLLKCFIILLLGFSHRPFHDNLLSFFILYSFIVMYYQQYRTKQVRFFGL